MKPEVPGGSGNDADEPVAHGDRTQALKRRQIVIAPDRRVIWANPSSMVEIEREPSDSLEPVELEPVEKEQCR
jgi:hypothetical protein